MSPCRVLLADDHLLVRAGIRALLDELEGVEVVAEASNGREAVSLARSSRADLVVMDISMPELNGIEATAQVKAALPATRVLILSMHRSADFVRGALAAGASGYIVKDSAPLELAMAVHAIRRGETYVSSRVAGPLLSELARGTPDGSPSIESLSSRQREILQLIAEGNSTKQIAFTLRVSTKTVETHRAAIMRRLGIRDIPGLVIYAVRNKLVDLDRPGS